MPLIIPIKYISNNINIFSFKFLLFLNKTKIPTPLPVNKPAIAEPNVIVPFKYNSVMIILAPQLGIKPTKLDINDDNGLFFKNILEITSSPK